MKLNPKTLIAGLAFAVGAFALSRRTPSAGEPPTPGGVPGATEVKTPEDAARLRAALAILRNLITAEPRHRVNLIKAFQTAAQIDQTGALDDLTMDAARAATHDQADGLTIMSAVETIRAMMAAKPAPAPVAPSAPVSPSAPLAPSTPPVSRLAEVVARNLEIAGPRYDRSAVMAFQKSAGLPADGLYGPRTRAALVSAGIADSRLPAPMFGAGKKGK